MDSSSDWSQGWPPAFTETSYDNLSTLALRITHSLLHYMDMAIPCKNIRGLTQWVWHKCKLAPVHLRGIISVSTMGDYDWSFLSQRPRWGWEGGAGCYKEGCDQGGILGQMTVSAPEFTELSHRWQAGVRCEGVLCTHPAVSHWRLECLAGHWGLSAAPTA